MPRPQLLGPFLLPPTVVYARTLFVKSKQSILRYYWKHITSPFVSQSWLFFENESCLLFVIIWSLLGHLADWTAFWTLWCISSGYKFSVASLVTKKHLLHFPLGLSWHCDLLWPTERDRGNAVSAPVQPLSGQITLPFKLVGAGATQEITSLIDPLGKSYNCPPRDLPCGEVCTPRWQHYPQCQVTATREIMSGRTIGELPCHSSKPQTAPHHRSSKPQRWTLCYYKRYLLQTSSINRRIWVQIPRVTKYL